VRQPFGVAKRDKRKPHDLGRHWFGGLQFCAGADGIPKVDIHGATPRILCLLQFSDVRKILMHDPVKTQLLKLYVKH
jgi:hypothetical protein